MEVAPFFVDFHHFLSIFTIFCQFSPFFIDFHDLRTFVAIYILSRFTHFFRNFFFAKIAFSVTSHVFCMYALEHHSIPSSPQVEAPLITSLHKVWFAIFQWPISNVVAGDCFYIKVHEDQSRYPLSKPGSEAGHSLLCPVFIIMSCVRGAAEPRYLNCFGYSNQENRKASPLSR